MGGQLFTSVRGSGSVASGGATAGTATNAASLAQQTVQVALQAGQVSDNTIETLISHLVGS